MARSRRLIIGLAFLAGLIASTPHGSTAQPRVLKTADRQAEKLDADTSATQLTKTERLALLRRAQIWTPTDVATMNIRVGPEGRGAFPPDASVACDYVPSRMSGASKKFNCATADGDVLKVRYGATNGEVQGSVLASRLLWALGFLADRVYPVVLTCRGCSPDPWTKREKVPGEQVFALAVIERKPEGREIETNKQPGWSWAELGLVDERQGGAPRAHRDALMLLAVFMQHTDSKPAQQRLLCLPSGATEVGNCERPFLAIHDVGLTFGHGNFSNAAQKGSVNFQEWARTPVWRDASACVGHLSKSHTGTLGDPKISESGRAFLANLLSQLTDGQLHDLFDVAQVERRSRVPNAPEVGAASPDVEEWVTAFKHKREEIISTRCPS